MPDFWNDPNSAWTRDWNNAGKAVNDAAVALGYAPKHVDPNAPGAALDTSNDEADRARIGALLAQLQQQAATGSGSWEKTLQAGTDSANATAMALGQSMPNTGYQSSLRNIANAQAGNEQRAVGQGNILRAQSQAGAQDKLSQLQGNLNAGDANRAAAEASARQGMSELDSTLTKAAKDHVAKDTQGAGGMLSMLSDGGKVPGQPQVFGDNEKNDTVPAMLSPGEIVIPRSSTSSPEAAMDFVRAMFAQRGAQHFDGGGQVGDGTGLAGPGGGTSEQQEMDRKSREAGVVSIILPHVGAAMQPSGARAPSVANGSLFDAGNYDASRAAGLANADMMQARANGAGPSVAGQQMQNATDDAIAAAMAGGGHGRAGASGAFQQAIAAQQGAAGNAAATRGAEQGAGQDQVAMAVTAQRARDAAFAQARQQAAFRQTLMNAGVGLEQQAALRGIMAGAGQAGMAYAASGKGKGGDFSGSDKNTPDFDQGFGPGGDPGGSDASEWSNPFAHGGQIGYADGGKVKTPWEQKMSDASAAAEKDNAAFYAKRWEDKKATATSEATRDNAAMAENRAAPSFLSTVAKEASKASASLVHRYSEGGEIPDDEQARASAFVTALRRGRR